MPTNAELYGSDFFERQRDRSRSSAQVVVPLVCELVRPRRVVDVGCGVGTWAAEFLVQGIDVLGIDGEHVDSASLQIPVERFFTMNLSQPRRLDQGFDLAVCLEVAEHLPVESAQALTGFLVALAPVVLFSAAVPGQPGVHHINPQWPSYWQQLFKQAGYLALDPLRPKVWHDERVALHYRQNMYLYVRSAWLQTDAGARLRENAPEANTLMLLDEDILKVNLGRRESLRRLLPAFLRSWLKP